jgi:hypothetical protein
MKLIKKFESFSLGNSIKLDKLNISILEDLSNKVKDAFLYLSDEYGFKEPRIIFNAMNIRGDLDTLNPNTIDFSEKFLDEFKNLVIDLEYEIDVFSSFDSNCWADFRSVDHLIKIANDIKRISESSFKGSAYISYTTSKFNISIILPNE